MVVVGNLLQVSLAKFDLITSMLEQFSNFGSMTLDKVIGSLKVHKENICDHQI